jgi:hypothetical protein
MDADLSRRLDRIENRIKVIGDLASAGFTLVVFLAFTHWLPDTSITPPEWVRFLLGILAMIAIPSYYRWQFNREPK